MGLVVAGVHVGRGGGRCEAAKHGDGRDHVAGQGCGGPPRPQTASRRAGVMSAPGDRGDGWRSGVGIGHDQTGADPTTTEDGLGDGCGDEGRTGHDGAGQCRRASWLAARAGGARVARSTLGDVAGKGKHVAWSAWSAIGVEAASRRLANGRRMKRPWDELRARGRMRCPHGLCIRSPFAGDGDIASDPPGVRVVRSLRLLHSRSRSPTANETPKGCSSPDLRTAHNRGSEARATGQRLPPLA